MARGIPPANHSTIRSHLYSYSFEQNADWTREYAGQEEILVSPRAVAIVAGILISVQQYIIGVAQKYELYRYIRFNTVVDAARWEDGEKKWKTSVTVTGAKGGEFGEHYTLTSDFLVSAVGRSAEPTQNAPYPWPR